MSDFVESEFIGKKPRKLDGRKARRKHFIFVEDLKAWLRGEQPPRSTPHNTSAG